jgi:hypothetical protein
MLAVVLVLSGISTLCHGQSSATGAPVPNLVNFAGTLKDSGGHPIQSVTGVTFSLYAQEEGGVPLWLETQSVQPDGKGNFTVQLGATKAEGLPLELFTSSTARWLGVRMNGGEEQPRVLLVSVPYALKAGDAATIGGLPPSAFVLAAPAVNAPVSGAASPETNNAAAPVSTPASSNVTTAGGTVNTIPLFTTGTNIQSSALSQSGTGTTTKVSLKGTLAFQGTGAATASAGKPSFPINTTASAFNSSTHTAVGQTFQLKAEPVANNTNHPGASMNLLFAQGAATPTETGFAIASNGRVSFASGQTFPGTGTITGVTAGTGLAGGGTTGTVALSVDSSLVPFLNTGNSFSGTQLAFSSTGEGFLGGSTSGFGVYGSSSSNNGVVGVSSTGTGVVGTSNSNTGVYGSSSSGYGVYGYSPNTYGVVGVTTNGNGVYGQVTAASQAGVVGRQLDASGNWGMYAFGNIGASGTKSSVVPVDNGTRQVALYAVESPGVWFEDYGSGRLVSGVATIKIDPAYAQTVNTGVQYHVFLTPDGDCEGLYVTARTATGFQVRELHQGKSNVAFDYRIIALRRGYETQRLADVTNATPRSTIETPLLGYAGSAAGTATAK